MLPKFLPQYETMERLKQIVTEFMREDNYSIFFRKKQFSYYIQYDDFHIAFIVDQDRSKIVNIFLGIEGVRTSTYFFSSDTVNVDRYGASLVVLDKLDEDNHGMHQCRDCEFYTEQYPTIELEDRNMFFYSILPGQSFTGITEEQACALIRGLTYMLRIIDDLKNNRIFFPNPKEEYVLKIIFSSQTEYESFPVLLADFSCLPAYPEKPVNLTTLRKLKANKKRMEGTAYIGMMYLGSLFDTTETKEKDVSLNYYMVYVLLKTGRFYYFITRSRYYNADKETRKSLLKILEKQGVPKHVVTDNVKLYALLKQTFYKANIELEYDDEDIFSYVTARYMSHAINQNENVKVVGQLLGIFSEYRKFLETALKDGDTLPDIDTILNLEKQLRPESIEEFLTVSDDELDKIIANAVENIKNELRSNVLKEGGFDDTEVDEEKTVGLVC